MTAQSSLLRDAAELRKAGQLPAAEAKLRELLAIQPDSVQARQLLGALAQQVNRHDIAAQLFREALELSGPDAGVLINLGNCFYALNQPEQAEHSLNQALLLEPDSYLAHYNLGKCLQDWRRPLEAIEHYKAALAVNQSIAEIPCNLGLAYLQAGDPGSARHILEQAVTRWPAHSILHYNLALALLMSGEFTQGWREYEWRIRHPDGRVRSIPIPEWQGVEDNTARLLVYAEQGVGDEIMFSSCLADLIHHCVAPITLECDPRLAPLFKRTFPELTVVGNDKGQDIDWNESFPGHDRKLSIASLPHHFRPTESSFSTTPSPYLKPDPELLQLWKARLAALGPQPKIGISWKGGQLANARARRTSRLVDWVPLLSIPAAQFVNLQYGDCSEELTELQRSTGITLHDWADADPLKDLDNFYAQVYALDLVISIDNSTVHFAGAAGTEVWNLVSSDPDFRWMRQRSDSYWYPQMRLFRQQDDGWTHLLTEAARALHDWLETH